MTDNPVDTVNIVGNNGRMTTTDLMGVADAADQLAEANAAVMRRVADAAEQVAAARTELIDAIRAARQSGNSLRHIGAAAGLSRTHIANLTAE